MRPNRIEITPAGAALGAEVTGVDLSQALDEDTYQQLHRALLEHLVIAFPRQRLTPEQFIAFGQRWGELLVHPNLVPSDIHPALIEVERRPGDQRFTGSEWHADATMQVTPPKYTMMYSKVVPPIGGDTLFANQYLAFEALSPGLQQMIGQMRCEHTDERVAGPAAGLNARRTNQTNESAEWQRTVNYHPVVQVHPQTGRPALFVNIAYTRGFESMTREESAPLLDFLLEANHRPEHTYRHQWSENMLVLWDNRALVHLAVNDCREHYRLMHRLQVIGERPRGLGDGQAQP